MQRWIALFRGINVSGCNVLLMKQLVGDLETLGFSNVRTYIQSGNAVFDARSSSAKNLASKIAKCVDQNHGFAPKVMVISRDELQDAIVANPFPGAVAEPKTLHFFFLDQPPKAPNIASLDQIKSSTETYSIIESVFYLHTPDGFGTSKLAANAEKLLGVAATARNYRTVQKVSELAGQ